MIIIFFNYGNTGDLYEVKPIIRKVIQFNTNNTYYHINKYGKNFKIYNDIKNLKFSEKFYHKYWKIMNTITNKNNKPYFIMDNILFINNSSSKLKNELRKNFYIEGISATYEYHKIYKKEIFDKFNLHYPITEKDKINGKMVPKITQVNIQPFLDIYNKIKNKKTIFYFNCYGLSGQMLEFNHIPVIDYLSKKI